jgi:hypothetical protein
MSGSSKYTTAVPTIAAQAVLAAQVRAREGSRCQAEEDSRRQRAAAQAAVSRSRLSALVGRIDVIRADAARTGSTAAVQDLAARASVLAGRLSPLTDAAEPTALSKEVDRADADARRLAVVVARALARTGARQERRAALAVLSGALMAAPQGGAFDPPGAARAARLLAAAARTIELAGSFEGAFTLLTEAVTAHLNQAAANEAVYERARDAARQARAGLAMILTESRAAGLRLSGTDLMICAAARLKTELDAGWRDAVRTEAARTEAESLARANTALARELETVLARLDLAEHVVQAIVAALPGAEFEVVPGSTVREGGRVMFRARRVLDYSVLDIEVTPCADGTVTIGYHTQGSDFPADRMLGAEAKYCDSTEATLEKLHAELEHQNIATTGLRWDGMPDRRPPETMTRPDPQQARPPRRARHAQHPQPDMRAR